MLSVARGRNSDLSSGSPTRDLTGWKRSMLILFHGAAATTYGFALGYQSVSEDSAALYAMTSELLRPFGKWRYLTYNCLVMHFVTYSLCFASNFVPRLKKHRDFMFSIFALPNSIMVFVLFWGLWHAVGRGSVFPDQFSRHYPTWLNHVTHTMILPVNLIELVSYRHHFLPERKALIPLQFYIFSYIGFSYFIRYYAGKWPYPVLNSLSYVQVGILSATMSFVTCLVYKFGRKFHDYVHGIKTAKANNKSNKKSK